MSGTSRRLVEIPSLDGLRAISIGIVFVSHAGFEVIPGGFGVSIFFVISGFLITTLLRVEGDATGRISLRDFYIRRVFRILPVFYVVLVLGLVAVRLGLGDGHVDAGATSSQFLHWYNWYAIWHSGYRIVPGTGIYWSLAIEEHFYLLFPLFIVFLRRRRLDHVRQGLVLLVGCALVLAWRTYLVYGQHVAQVRTYYGTDTRFDGLLFGCAAALIFSPILDRRRTDDGRVGGDATPRVPWARWPVALGGAAVIGATMLFRNDGFRESIRYTIQSIAIVACLRYAIVAVGSPLYRVLNAKVVAWFGRMSYGFYLVHQIIISGLQQRLSSKIVVLVVSFVLSAATAWALHRLVERPMGRLRARVLRSGRRAAAVVAAAVVAPPWPAPAAASRFTSATAGEHRSMVDG